MAEAAVTVSESRPRFFDLTRGSIIEHVQVPG